MLGHHGSVSLASMQISGPYVWTLTGVMGALQVGAIALVGREVGAGGRGSASAARGALAASMILGVVAGVLAMATLAPTLGLFTAAGPAVVAEARAYLEVMMPALPLFLVASM